MIRESRFLLAAHRQPVDRTPIWWMRQAGRTLPEHRRIRARRSLREIVADPELCAAVTLQPVRRFALDAAVLYADIMLPLAAMGVDFEIVESVGPLVHHPARSFADIDRLRVPDVEEVAPQVTAAIGVTVSGDRLLRWPVHARQLSDRGPAHADLRCHRHVHARAPRCFRRIARPRHGK